MKFAFGDIVIVEEEHIGVIVKSWGTPIRGGKRVGEPSHFVYVRTNNAITEYKESEIERYMVRHKYLSEEEKEYQYNAINGL